MQFRTVKHVSGLRGVFQCFNPSGGTLVVEVMGGRVVEWEYREANFEDNLVEAVLGLPVNEVRAKTDNIIPAGQIPILKNS